MATETINGTGGNDLIQGGSSNSSIDGGAGNDTIFGNAGNDTLLGGDGADSLVGGDGNDSLTGGAGIDTLVGGLGDDGYGIDAVNELGKIVELAGEGTDAVAVTFNYKLALANIENVFGYLPVGVPAGTFLKITGDDANNTVGGLLETGSLGSFSLDGAGGNDLVKGHNNADTLTGGAGIDTLVGSLGNDYYVLGSTLEDLILETTNTAGGIDTVEVTNVSYTLASQHLENLLGRATTVSPVPPSTPVVITLGGNTANNLITGQIAAGADAVSFSLLGQAGNDTLLGAGGHDMLEGGNDNDSLAGGFGQDWLLGGDGNDFLSGDVGNDTVNGGAGNDTLEAGDGADSLFGGDGADILRGGAGNDSYNLGNAVGDVAEEAADGGTDRVLLSDAQSYTLSENIENVNMGLTVNSGAIEVRLVANDLSNLIKTGAANATQSFFILAAGGNDKVTASLGNDSVGAGAGDDTVFGLAGNDELYGEFGADALYGGGGADVLGSFQDGARDTLNGGAGDDVVQSAGGDLLIGGAGNDLFVLEQPVDGASTIKDFGIGNDVLQYFGTGQPPVSISESQFFAGAAAHDADDRYIFKQSAGELYYDADGNGGGAQVLIAKFQIPAGIPLVVTAADILG